MDRRPYEAVQPLGGRGLDAQVTTPLYHGLFEMVWAPRGGHYLLREPSDQRLAIGDRGFAEAQVLADLRPVILDSPTVPDILRPGVSWHADLLGDMVHNGGRGTSWRCPWESSSILEELQEHGKAQARGPMFVLDQRPFSRGESSSDPLIPSACSRNRPYALSSSSSTCHGRRSPLCQIGFPPHGHLASLKNAGLAECPHRCQKSYTRSDTWQRRQKHYGVLLPGLDASAKSR